MGEEYSMQALGRTVLCRFHTSVNSISVPRQAVQGKRSRCFFSLLLHRNLQEKSIRRADEPLALFRTRKWVEQFVIGLGLCPWAGPVQSSIKYVLSESKDRDAVADDLTPLLDHMIQYPDPETAILVAPNFEPDNFTSFFDLVAEIGTCLTELGSDDVLMVVRFHPKFYFQGDDEHDAGNYVNRSPYPMFHVLRQAGVTEATGAHPNADNIAFENKHKLQGIGKEQLGDWLSDFRGAH